MYLSDLICVNGNVCLKGSEKPFTGHIDDEVGFPFTEIRFSAKFVDGRINKNYTFNFESPKLELLTLTSSIQRDGIFYTKDGNSEETATGVVHIKNSEIRAYGPCIFGRREGLWVGKTLESDDDLVYESHYLHGKLVGKQWEHYDGETTISHYNDGVLHGEYSRGHGISPAEESGFYKNGVKNGTWYIEHRTLEGIRSEETQYWIDGKMVGSEYK
ncbi:MAG: hypothetical protein HON27_00960 [Candidatus Marinimicrobia bacterium]|jgi:hypothetical protein|nr:hypothetical protein [Candidatus Neomarinimicrobiota bacterium]MBT4360978.1 hypothetical protein [Candidatus Neomarinimicrobiota bacterium]MBT4944717.1 hypothetical protein [Candidatus Neomarinimicrobiota bacterium]MBT5271691.1 hypothetical protein [Candidatus Neomarinimicrobiota bacterium]MBT7199888.1 hypothetical protein [Candidatus Neomarinimicrobiota bacterium]